ncbi:MAG: AAA family ATPase [Armatimonadota bacterium]
MRSVRSMAAIPGYVVQQTIQRTGQLIICRGRRLRDRREVLIKLAVPGRDERAAAGRLETEYKRKSLLDSSWAIMPLEMVHYDHQKALILEDPEGRALDTLLGPPLDMTQFLDTAVDISQALAEVHRRGIIHRDIRPQNIFLDDTLRITGFGASSFAPERVPSSEIAEEMFAYMSPEQTGRMNRPADHRTDLYSLGVVLYQMLTGTLPFESSTDPLDMVYLHFVKRPTPPSEILPCIPPTVSEIILKLMEKTVEERYQTATGVMHDLKKCLEQWDQTGGIKPFALAQLDISDRLLMPQKLYGRADEINALSNAFDRVVRVGNSDIVMVAGYSGIGKTSVVKELYSSVIEQHGNFISGKFDQYKRNIPYVTIAEAFQELTRQILTQSEMRVEQWRQKLQEALGASAQLIVDLVPQMELIIGKQPPVPYLAPEEAKNRFSNVFRQFVGVFAKQEHPLVLFLDDMQWVDTGSLHLLKDIITDPDMRYLLLIGAYRDNEVCPSHPLITTLDEISKTRTVSWSITLSSLSFEDLNSMVADALQSDTESVKPFAELVYEKTGGNPFFVIQFLQTLYGEGLVWFEADECSWKWDIDGICAKAYTDNVVDLMIRKLRQLPIKLRDTLRLAACIGNRFDADTLAIISGMSSRRTHQVLEQALEEGLIQHLEEMYSFVHDRIQEAAYLLIPRKQRGSVHLAIGRLLLEHTPSEEVEEHVFEIVNQLNRAQSLIADESERDRLAELNLLAGRKAKASVAHQSATAYFTSGLALIPQDGWQTRYHLTYGLCLELAECEYLSANIEAAEHLLTVVLENANTRIDKTAAYQVLTNLHTTLGRNAKAVETATECLDLYNIHMVQHPEWDAVILEYEDIGRNMANRQIEDLVDLPEMTDRDMQAAMLILGALIAPAYYTDQNLLLLLACKMVNTCLRYGRTDASVVAYAIFGTLLGPIFGRYQDGYRFGKMACELVDKYDLVAHKAKVYLAFGDMTSFWTRHFAMGLPYMYAGREAGIESGDLAYASYCSAHLVQIGINTGRFLGDVISDSEKSLDFVKRSNYSIIYDDITSMRCLPLNMRGLTNDFSTFSTPTFDQARFEEHLIGENKLTVCWYYIMKMAARFISGNYAEAISAAHEAEPLLWTVFAHTVLPEYHYYYALTLSSVYDESPPEKQEDYLGVLANYQEKLRVWAENGPDNFRNKYALVSAEIARITDSDLDAMRLYEQAIESARDSGFPHNEGIANELASRFYRQRNLNTVADVYLRNARACYLRWGADAKMRQIDQNYPELIETTPTVACPHATIGQFDAVTVIRTSQAISSRILLSDVIETLMQAVIQNAGAQRGYLILFRDDQPYIAAKAEAGPDAITVVQNGNLPIPEVLPESVINYVRRTMESIILADASVEQAFKTDDYIVNYKPRSIMCLPIVKQTKLIGLLYVENNLVTGAFTADRFAVLEMLAAQAAISLENAILYEERKQAEEKRRQLQHESETEKRQFYRETILSVTEGKLDITDEIEVDRYILNAEWSVDVPDASAVSAARHAVERFCKEKVLPRDRIDAFIIGVGEAITNAIKHAGQGRVYAGTTPDYVWAGIADKGKGIASLILPRAVLLRGFSTQPSLGLGYSVILEMVDNVILKTDREGSTVILIEHFQEPRPALLMDVIENAWRDKLW